MGHFLTRHAIFDRKSKVYAYELSFRTQLDELQKIKPKSDQKTSKVLTDSFFLIGIEKITSGKTAFVRFTKNLLISDFAKMFPKEQIVVEIGPEVIADGPVIVACEDLKKSGYKIVLDDFTFNPNSTALIPYADMVKVDVQQVGEYIKKTIVQKMQPRGIKCLAKNVESQELYYKAFPKGFDYFQGNFFSKPVIMEKKNVPVQKFSSLEMLKEVTQPEIDFTKIENIIKRDVSLTYKLLKMINSSAYGIKNEVKSINQALVLLGANEVKRWITLVILSTIGDDKPDELMKKTLLRAKFLELIAPLTGFKPKAADLFLTGMFSLMDVLMGQPLKTILDGLPLSAEIKDTILGLESPYKKLFEFCVGYENGDWNAVQQQAAELKIEEDKLPELFQQAAEWVNQVAM